MNLRADGRSGPEAPERGESKKGSYGQRVPAVDQATRILFLLAGESEGRATLTRICQEVGIHKSKGFAILNTLRSTGLVTRDSVTKAYSLGPAHLLLSRAMLDHADFTRLAVPFLEALASAPGTTAFLALVWGRRLFIVARRDAQVGLDAPVRFGYRWYPLTWGAMGKAIVPFLPEAEREETLDLQPLFFQGDPISRAPDLDALRLELAEVKRVGYATDPGRVQRGLVAVSAPIFGVRAGEVRPIGCVTVAGGFPEEQTPAYGERVKDTAQHMTEELGLLMDGLPTYADLPLID